MDNGVSPAYHNGLPENSVEAAFISASFLDSYRKMWEKHENLYDINFVVAALIT